MSESMYDCYLSQFECMKKIMENRTDILTGFAEIYKEADPDRLYLVGSGTSYHACCAAAYFLEELLEKEVSVVAPTCAEHIYGKKPFIIAVSQGGRSTNTVAAVKNMRRMGHPVVTLTDPADTPVGKAGSLPLLLPANMELVGPKTRGYTATVLTLYLMALDAAKITGKISEAHFAAYMRALENMTEQGEEWFGRCQIFYDRNREDLKAATHYLFAGKGVRGKVAQEDALKILETLCFPANGYEYEEFLHGPACSTDEGLAVFLYLSHDKDDARMQRTVDIIGGASKNCYMISHTASMEGDKVLYLPGSEAEYISPFSDILMGQLIAARLPEEIGRERHPAIKNIFQDMGTKIPQQQKYIVKNEENVCNM